MSTPSLTSCGGKPVGVSCASRRLFRGEIADSGEAIGTSATVLGLDVACMIGSICGIGHLPRLLIHDSPREADMEPEMYYQLFQFIADIERAFEERPPSFQYIVTTTTPPPIESGQATLRLRHA